MNIKHLSFGLLLTLGGCASNSLDQVNRQVHQCNQIGCESNNFEVEVVSETNPNADRIDYITYAWVAEASLVLDTNHNWTSPTIDPIVEFKYAIDTAMRAKGFLQVTHNPDLIVAFSVGANADKIALHKLAKKQKTITNDVPDGAALLVIADPKTKTVQYISLATGNIDQDISSKETMQRIKYVGEKLVQDFNR